MKYSDRGRDMGDSDGDHNGTLQRSSGMGQSWGTMQGD